MTSPHVEGAAQRRLTDELLAWGQPRPAVPAGLVVRLRDDLEAGLAAFGPGLDAAAGTARDRTLTITSTSLSRLVCDGWQRDPLTFEHGPASTRGMLTVAAIERDWTDRRASTPMQVAQQVWDETASQRPGDPASLSRWLNDRSRTEATALCDEVASLVTAFREVWPLLPEHQVVVELRRPVAIALAGGRVRLRGTPGLVLSSPRHEERLRTLVVDLRTGLPRPEPDRARLRFHALLVTLDRDRPPFRWATYHVTEGRAEVESFDAAPLHRAVAHVLDGVRQAVRLATHPTDEGLMIRGGPWCSSCRRAPVCPEAAAGRARYEAGVDDRRA